MTTATTIGQKLWNYCNILRDAGLSYGDYLEQLTYLIFLKMMDERTGPAYTMLPDYQPPPIPEGCRWPDLLALEGAELESHYRRTLETLGGQPGTLGVIFRKAQNRIQEPAMLTRLVRELINSEDWLQLSADVKGDAYESLLERNAQDVKTGAGQYFTPRPLIRAMVDVMRPGPDDTVCDPACGTGGFLLAAHDYIVETESGHEPGPKGESGARRFEWLGDCGQRGPALRYEPVPPQHRWGRHDYPSGRQPAGPPRCQLRPGADQPALRPQVVPHLRQQRGRDGAGGADGGAA